MLSLFPFTRRMTGGARLFCVILTSLLLSTPCGASNAAQNKTSNAVPGEFIVRFRKEATDTQIQDGIRVGQMHLKRHLQTGPMAEKGENGLTLVNSDLAEGDLIQKLKNHPAVELVEPNYIYTTQVASNDPYFSAGNLWGMYGDLSSPANVYGSQAAEAWANGYTGTNTVYVAVVDEGIQVSHPDLAPNIWQNPFESADGLDNDGNGYIDDLNGWDFYNDRAQVFESSDTHGTHVAGTIGARGGNGLGVAGVNWNIGIISAKFMSGGSGSTLDAVAAIDYVVDLKKRHGMNIVAINASWGGSGYAQSLQDSIIRAAKAGILFVAAAGNNTANNDTTADYPANIDTRAGTSTETAASYDSVISVAAIDNAGGLASFSNYGATKVHLGAPGVNILSTYPTNSYAYMSGTSMATPHVTGAVALYASTHPGATADQIRSAILGAVVPTLSLSGRTSTGGRLDLSTVMAPSASQPPPAALAAPTGVALAYGKSPVSANEPVAITWSASSGAATYTVKRATSSAGPWTTASSGLTARSFTDTVPASGGTYFWTVAAVNGASQSANATPASALLLGPVPANLTATASSATQLQLNWLDRTSDELGFKVEYWNGYGWTQIGTLAANSSSVSITGTVSKATYYFRVRAYSSALNTAYSNTTAITMP